MVLGVDVGDDAIPVIESHVFHGDDQHRFAVIATQYPDPHSSTFTSEFEGAAKLRANTYLEHGFVTKEHLDASGTELDRNDTRSAHFIVLERCDAEGPTARVVGNMRIVVKHPGDTTPLPVEDYFPEVFQAQPLPVRAVEVSRLIARHENRRIQQLLAWPLFVAGHRFVTAARLGPVLGLLSPALTRQLQGRRIPVAEVAIAKHIAEINATKLPVAIDLTQLGALIREVGDQGTRPEARGRFVYVGFEQIAEVEFLSGL